MARPRSTKSANTLRTPRDSVPSPALASSDPAARWRRAIPVVIVALIGLAAFLPTLSNGFVSWDDDRNIYNNQDYRGLAWSNIQWMWTTFLMGHFQPLSWMTLGLDYTIWGMNPLGYHLTNTILHGISSGLLTLVIARLLAIRPGERGHEPGVATPIPDVRSLWIAAAISALWAVHPLRVEAVVWVTQRREVLCSVLTLLTILHHLRGGRWWTVAILAALAMLSKATAVVLPPMLVLIDLYRAGVFARLRLGPSGGAWAESARAVARNSALVGLAVACSLTAIQAQKDASAMLSSQQLGWVGRFTEYFYSIGFYVQKTIWPTRLLPLYEARGYFDGTMIKIDTSPLVPVAIAGAAGLCVLLAAGWALRRSVPWLLPLVIAYAAMIAPVGGLGQSGPQVAADRYTYQPGWVLTLGLALGCWEIARRLLRMATPPWWLLSVAAPLCAVCAVLSVSQERIWRSSTDLWMWTVTQDPSCGIAQYNMGMVYQEPETLDDAKAELFLREALRLQPFIAERSTAVAAILVRKGKTEEAIRLYTDALKYNSRLKPALFLLANLLYSNGRQDEAVKYFDRLAEVDPTNMESYRTLARALAAMGRARDAVVILDQGVKRVPNSPELWQLRAWLSATSPDDAARNAQRAVESAERALSLVGPKRDNALIVCVAAAYAEAQRFDDAARFLEQSIPTADPAAREALGSMRDQMLRRQPVRTPARFP